MPSRSEALHLAALLAVLLLVQAPRAGGLAGRLAAPVFPPGRGFLDFDRAYYPAAVAIVGDPGALYGEARNGKGKASGAGGPRYFVNIPVAAWLFVPFTVLSPGAAGLVLLALNIVASLVCLLLVLRWVAWRGRAWRWAVTFTFATSGPLMNALNLGQTTPLILLLLILVARNVLRRRDGRAGLCLALACAVKIPPLLWLPYFAVRRRWRVVIVAGALLGSAVALSVVLYGWRLHETYLHLVIGTNLGSAIAAHNCQSIRAFVARLATGASLRSWAPVVMGSGARSVEWVLVGGVLAASVWALAVPVGRRDDLPTLLELSIVLCASLIVLPVSWVHYGLWTLPVFAVVGSALLEPMLQDQLRWTAPSLAIALLLVNFPMPPRAIIEKLGDATWFRLAVSHQLIGTVLLWALCIWSVRRLSR